MSTSSTVYDLQSRTGFYLDHAYWLCAPAENLLTAGNMQTFVTMSLDRLGRSDDDDRERSWLESLLAFVRDRPNGEFIVIHDTSDWSSFDNFRMYICIS